MRVVVPVHVGPGAASLPARLCAIDPTSGLEVFVPSHVQSSDGQAALEGRLPALAAGCPLGIEVPAGRFERVTRLGVTLLADTAQSCPTAEGPASGSDRPA